MKKGHIHNVLAQSVLKRFGDAIRSSPRKPFVLGICGAQGSGKSTLAAAMCNLLSAQDLQVAVLSLDDLYLTKAERGALAQAVHPLLATRGVPGTHDLALAEKVLQEAAQPCVFALPRFDKGLDDRQPQDQWPRVQGPLDVLILEGWCLGARPQTAAQLAPPVNALERDQDPQGLWRGWVNQQLATAYQDLFDRVDRLILLAAPGFHVVKQWRTEQEQKLRASGLGMSDPEIDRFIQHYQRLTEHILKDMPAYADMVVHLGDNREVVEAPLPGLSQA